MLSSCDSNEPEEIEPNTFNVSFPANVEYRVYGEANAASINYLSEESIFESVSPELPWSISFVADTLRPLYASVQSVKDSILTVEIWANGELIKSITKDTTLTLSGALAWNADTNPQAVYFFSGGEEGAFGGATVEIATRRGPRTMELPLNDGEIGFREIVDVEPGFASFIKSNYTLTRTGFTCPSNTIGYTNEKNKFYNLASVQSCNGSNTITATIP